MMVLGDYGQTGRACEQQRQLVGGVRKMCLLKVAI